MKKKIALGLVMCMVGLSILGCGGDTPTDTPSAAPTATPFPQPTGSLAVCTQWLNKIHIGDSYEQVRQAVGKEPEHIASNMLIYVVDSFGDCNCENKLGVVFNSNIDPKGKNEGLVVENFSIQTNIVNKHANSEGKVETVDEHMGAWENYLMELYGQHTSIKTLSDDYVILTWEGETLDNSDFTKISISISYDEGQEERPFVSVDFY